MPMLGKMGWFDVLQPSMNVSVNGRISRQQSWMQVPSIREQYLSDPEFREVLGLDKEQFASLPLWKQQQLKKDTFLF